MYKTLATISLAALGAAGLLITGAHAAPSAAPVAGAMDATTHAAVQQPGAFYVADANEPSMDLKGIGKQGGTKSSKSGGNWKDMQHGKKAPANETNEPQVNIHRLQKLDGNQANATSGGETKSGTEDTNEKNQKTKYPSMSTNPNEPEMKLPHKK